MENLGYANQIGYSDVNPYEVVRRVSEKQLEIRAMKVERLHEHAELGFQPGGFFGHHAEQHKQRWKIEANPEAPIVKIRLSAAKRKAGYWFDKWGSRYSLGNEPIKFYDYNF